jgi:hypothetical protein
MSNWSENNLELWCKMVLDVLAGISGKMDTPHVTIKTGTDGIRRIEFNQRTMVKGDYPFPSKIVNKGDTVTLGDKTAVKNYPWATGDDEMKNHMSKLDKMISEYQDWYFKHTDPMADLINAEDDVIMGAREIVDWFYGRSAGFQKRCDRKKFDALKRSIARMDITPENNKK